MICGFCSESLTDEPAVCPACGQSPLLDARYRLERIVGRGAMGVTYRAERLEDGQAVAIKELPFRRIDAVKTKALFEREARVLEQLDHPGIPAYLDDFVGGVGKNLSLYLVQAFVEGDTLTAEQAQRRWREDEVLAITAEVADILTYLHELSPPVIHRDIKPGNVMRRPDGRLALIDFGAVRDALDDEHTGGSTVVGTYGYMAPEQYKGDASPASDLYALGAMTVAMLARKTPDALVDVSGRLDWQRHLDVHPQTAALLNALLQVDPRQRPQRARDVAARCRQAIAAIEADRNAPVPMQPVPKPAPVRPAPAPNAPYTLNAPNAPNALNAPNAPEALVSVWKPPAESPITSSPTRPVRQAGGVKLIAISVMILALMVAGMLALTHSESSIPQRVDERRCGDQPCPPVAQGLKGLRFGMTIAEATAALPALASAKRSRKHLPIGIMDLNRPMLTRSTPLPGEVLTVQTTLGNLPAKCTLDFIDAGKLTHMACRLAKQTTRDSHMAAEQALLAALTKRYGPPSSQHSDNGVLVSNHEAQWRWADDQAELSLASKFMDFGALTGGATGLSPTSELTVTNHGQAHERVMQAAQEAQDAAREQAAAVERRKAEEAARKAREALKSGKLGDDL